MGVEHGGVKDLFNSAFGRPDNDSSPDAGTEGELNNPGSLEAKNPFKTDSKGLPNCPAAPAISDRDGLPIPWKAGFNGNGRPANIDGIIALLTVVVEDVAENGSPGSEKDDIASMEELGCVGIAPNGRPENMEGLEDEAVLTVGVDVLEDIGTLLITVEVGVDGFGDATERGPCPGYAARGLVRFIPGSGVVGADGGFNVLAGEPVGAGAGVAEGVGGAEELFPGEARGFAGAGTSVAGLEE